MSRLRVTLRRSPTGNRQNQRNTARALGLTRIRGTVVRPDTPAVRGMIRTISHLVSVEEIEEEDNRQVEETKEGDDA